METNSQEKPFVNYSWYRALFTFAVCLSVWVFCKIAVLTVSVYLLHKYLPRAWNRWLATPIDTTGRAVFITGCDSGLGHTFAKHLDSIGFHVFAGCFEEGGEGAKKLKKTCSSRLRIVPVDVTNNDAIARAFEIVQSKLPLKGLWGVINNAGIDTDGELEFVPVHLFEKVFNVNLFGQIRVAKQFLPLIRLSKGRVINITSVRGRMRQPWQGCYSSSKHMVEKFTDSLRLEMKKFGVKVVVIEPGNFAHCTSIENENMVKRKAAEVEEMWNLARPEVQGAYSKSYVKSWTNVPLTRGWTSNIESMKPVTSAVAEALCSPQPRERYIIDGYGPMFVDDHAVICRFYNILPTWIMDKIIALWTGCDEMKEVKTLLIQADS